MIIAGTLFLIWIVYHVASVVWPKYVSGLAPMLAFVLFVAVGGWCAMDDLAKSISKSAERAFSLRRINQ